MCERDKRCLNAVLSNMWKYTPSCFPKLANQGHFDKTTRDDAEPQNSTRRAILFPRGPARSPHRCPQKSSKKCHHNRINGLGIYRGETYKH